MRNECREELAKTLAIDPNHAEAHYLLAVALYKEGEYEKAVEHCDSALKLKWDVPEAFVKALQPHRK